MDENQKCKEFLVHKIFIYFSNQTNYVSMSHPNQVLRSFIFLPPEVPTTHSANTMFCLHCIELLALYQINLFSIDEDII